MVFNAYEYGFGGREAKKERIIISFPLQKSWYYILLVKFCFQCLFSKKQCPTTPMMWFMVTEYTSSPLDIEISCVASLTNGILTGSAQA